MVYLDVAVQSFSRTSDEICWMCQLRQNLSLVLISDYSDPVLEPFEQNSMLFISIIRKVHKTTTVAMGSQGWHRATLNNSWWPTGLRVQCNHLAEHKLWVVRGKMNLYDLIGFMPRGFLQAFLLTFSPLWEEGGSW